MIVGFQFFSFLATAQMNSGIPMLNNVVSPSPNAAALGEYVTTRPDLSTGVPSITVPVHTITSKKLTWPIVLSYHAAGIKVAEVGGWVGTGWTLLGANAAVSRVMRGLPDELTNGYFSYAGSVPDDTAPVTVQMKKDLAEGNMDMIPDIFYFHTGQSSGRIMFDNNLIPRTIPLGDASVTANPQTLSEFKIVEPDGTVYQFADFEVTNTLILGPDPAPFKSTWYLTRIISADKSDTIQFNYSTYSYQFSTNEQSIRKYYYNVPAGASKSNHLIESVDNISQVSIPAAKVLSSIVFSGGKLEFQSSSRQDDGGKKLDAIIIYYRDPFTRNYVEQKRINFAYGYFGSSGSANLRLRLDNFQQQASGQFLPAHSFQYDSKTLPGISSKAQDHWGYYNGKTANNTLIPARSDGTWIISNANREVDVNYVAGCILKKIINPLQGETEFEFEPNQYLLNGVEKYGPGLRIKRIISRDASAGIAAVRNFEYKRPDNSLSSGKLLDEPAYDIVMPVKDQVGSTTHEYLCWFIYAQPMGVGNFFGSPILYEYATEYNGDNYNVAGKAVSKFSLYTPGYSGYPYSPEEDDSWIAGRLIEQELFKVVNSSPTRIKRIEDTYQIHAKTFQIKGLKVAFNKILINAVPNDTDFSLVNFFTYSKHQYLQETKQYSYEETGGTTGAVETRTFHLDPELDHTLPVKVVTQTSDGGVVLQEELVYPADLSGGVFDKMKSLNMIALPVERKLFSIQGANEYLVSYSKFDFSDWGNLDIYPQAAFQPKVTAPVLRGTFNANPAAYIQKSATVEKYSDVGFPVQTKPENGLSNSVLFDPYFNKMIATCSPATLDQIAYTGFESPYRGQWIVNQGSSQKTGSVALSLSNPSRTFEIHASQSINYSYSITRTAGPSPVLHFTKINATPISQTLSLTSGSGSVSLSPGTWTVEVSAEWNVTALSLTFNYQYTSWNPLNVSSTAKTGLQSLNLQTGNVISRNGLPAGDYVVSYYQRNGAVSLTVSGSATILNTESFPAEPDGWTLIRKKIRIVNSADNIQLTGSGCLLDELRLQPVESMMSTESLDCTGRLRTQTDQNLRSVYYDYDVWDRLIIVRDHDRNIVSHKEYKLASN